MSEPIDIDRIRQSVLNAVTKITEQDFLDDVLFPPTVVASLSHAFTKYLIQDEQIDPKARLDCFDRSVDLYLNFCAHQGEHEDLISEDDDEEFFASADDEDIQLRNICIGLLECCSLLEQSVGARPMPETADWLIDYGPLRPKKKKSKTLSR